jgi:energy-coupling factor transporter ATP-binding protein EcfA2
LSSSDAAMEITSVRFKNFKALRDFSIALGDMNVLVGPNNSGKSTIIGSFRVLASALRKARSKRPSMLERASGHPAWGYSIDAADVPVSLENAHTDYGDGESTVSFRIGNDDHFILEFPVSGGCRLFVESQTCIPPEPKVFRNRYPITLGIVPVLGQVEHEEPLLQRDTVQAALMTHRASRHFRNYWYHNPEEFPKFQEAISRTWPEIEVRRPELFQGAKGTTLGMFCRENRIDRELYWIGSGFQIWCQLLTHMMRASDTTMMIVDEPEIYLHPDMQRQLLSVFRTAGPKLLMATHSSELVAEAEPTDILLVNKKMKSARRMTNVDALQGALEHLGSAHNMTLAQLARTRRLLFVEGEDFRLLRRFAERAGLPELAK